MAELFGLTVAISSAVLAVTLVLEKDVIDGGCGVVKLWSPSAVLPVTLTATMR